MSIAFPGESAQYRAGVTACSRRRWSCAARWRRSRRRGALPPGGAVPEDYVFEGGTGGVRLSEMFAPGSDSHW